MTQNENQKRLSIILSSPSGGGKSSISRALIAGDSRLVLSISVTTRAPRPADIDGVQYFFRSKDDFLAMIDKAELLEYSEIYNNLYGIPKNFVEKQTGLGKDIIFDIDSQGAYKLKGLLQNVVTIFILPPSLEELRRRLEARNQDSPKEIDIRMQLAKSEMEQAKNYDYVVINDDFTSAVDQVNRLISRERTKRGLIGK